MTTLSPPATARVRRLAALAATLLVAACATPPAPAPGPGAAVPAAPSATPGEVGGRLKPMPIRPLDIQAECRFKDEVGYTATAMLDISHAEVNAFGASVDVPRRGQCRFDGPFDQVKRMPHVELVARDGCTVSIWEQGEQVTVAFTHCAGRCTRGTFDYVWPIIVDRPSGECH